MSFNRNVFRDYVELTKPRICLLALIMACLGFFLGSEGATDFFLLFRTLLGLALVGAASGILNQCLEHDIDALMWRTHLRPIPAGRIPLKQAVIVGLLCAIAGEFVLLIGVNAITAVLGGLTVLFYLAVYTPSKRITSLSTLIGAIPGALPPLMGFTAAHGSLAPAGWLLFAILFIWQIPHFLAIAWLYREDYARAGLPVLSVIDEEGLKTAKHIVLYSVVLLPLSLLPTLWGYTGSVYFYGSLLLGIVLILYGCFLAVFRSKVYARRLFIVSILYLPALGLLMVWNRVG